jgi:DUF438 domain-containing protein
MSEFTNKRESRILKLKEVSELLLNTGNAREFIVENEEFIQTVLPTDFIYLFDQLVSEGYPMGKLKLVSNKVLNIFRIPIENFESISPEPDSFLGVLERNNAEMKRVLVGIRPVYKAFIKDLGNESVKAELLQLFKKLEVFVKHYTIKENVLFPVIEKNWNDYRCLKIMWSFHDDIRRDIKTVIHQLSSGQIEFRKFNRCVGDIFFHMQSIKFREECILFPHILATFSEEQLAIMNREGFEMGYPYFQPPKPDSGLQKTEIQNGMANLGTGVLTVEQIKLVFNHLPVDITYVDEQNRVRYFSTPKKRIFPRTTAIIGREVKNCHPPESVHVVERIVESFKRGEKSSADFWIKVKGEFVLIQYFAVRDDLGNYKGVIEVSQEISDIQALEGEKRLLDW